MSRLSSGPRGRCLLPVRLVLVALVPAGAILLFLPEATLRPALLGYALTQSPDGMVSEPGLHQMLLAVRLAGLATLVAGLFGLGLVGLGQWLSGDTTPMQSPAQPTPWTRRDVLLVAALVVLGLLLRLPRMGSSLYFDEAFTVLNFVDERQPLTSLVRFKTLNNHVLFSALAGVSSAIFGRAEWAFRLPALLAGLGTVAVAYGFGRRLDGRRGALVSGVILATAPAAVLHSTQARGYSQLIFFSYLALFTLTRAAETPSLRRWAEHVAVSVCGIWTHLFMAITTLGQALGLLAVMARRRLRRRPAGLGIRLVLALLAIGALSTVAYAPILHRVVFEITGFTLVPRGRPLVWPPGAPRPPGALVGLVAGTWAGPRWAQQAFTGVALLILLLAVRTRKRPLPEALWPILGPIALALPALLVVNVRAFGDHRFFLVVLPSIYALLSCGVCWLLSTKHLLGAVACVAVLSLQVCGLAQHYRSPEPRLKAFAEQVRARLEPGDTLVTDPVVGDVLGFYMPGVASTAVPCLDSSRRTLLACRDECDRAPAFATCERGETVVTVDELGLPYQLIVLRPLRAPDSAEPTRGHDADRASLPQE